MEKVRVGILGTGGIAKIHAWALTSVSHIKLVAVASRSLERARDFAKGRWSGSLYAPGDIGLSYEIERAMNYDEILESDEVDAVYVCLPNALHYEYCMRAMENGKHCFVEKPMTVKAEEAWKLVKKAKEMGVVLQVGHMWRFHNDVKFARRVVKEGIIGDIVRVKAYSIHVFFYPKGWFVDPRLSGGGALLDMGVHAIDTVQFVLGEGYSSVYADISTSYINYPVDDTDVLFLKTISGIPVLVESGWAQMFSSKKEASIEIYGEKGFVSVFPTFAITSLAGEYGEFRPSKPESHESLEMFRRQAENFAKSILGIEEPLCSGEDGAKVIGVVEAAYESSKKGVFVDVNSTGVNP